MYGMRVGLLRIPVTTGVSPMSDFFLDGSYSILIKFKFF